MTELSLASVKIFIENAINAKAAVHGAALEAIRVAQAAKDVFVVPADLRALLALLGAFVPDEATGTFLPDTETAALIRAVYAKYA